MSPFFRIALISCLLLGTQLLNAEPPNLGLVRKDIQAYHDSGAYEKELTEVITKARKYLTKQVDINNRSKNKKKLAIVLDIDETSLSNYKKIVNRNFAATQEEIHQEIMDADSPVIKPMLDLYNDAVKHDVSVFFVTGRHQSETNATKANLLKAGYKDWAGLYLRPDNYHGSSIVNFKAKTRAQISHKGYTIIETIGDQYSDLLGGYAKKEFKLPNPFYYLP